MNILITGAGLIGANAARHAVEAGHKVVLFDLSPNRDYIQKVVGKDKADVVAADMRDLPALLSALEKFNVDTMVHTAGLIGGRVQENSYTGATNNILGTINILEASRLRKLKRVVYVSTFGVYERGKINDGAIRESHPIGGHNLYAATKVCSEHLVHAYAGMYNLDTIIIRPGGVFGRGFYVGGSTVGMVMRDLALRMIKGDPITHRRQNLRPQRVCLRQGRRLGALSRLPSAQSQAAHLQRRNRRRLRRRRSLPRSSRSYAQDRSQSQRRERRGQEPQYPDGYQRLQSRAGICAEVFAERSVAGLYGRVVGRRSEAIATAQARQARRGIGV